ncbi:MAG: hydrogenase [Candidatus Omnitrophica bacterium]|nr:hydrogenase [Candidatus Omnitrophota bacterium]MDE2214078.1 hydrogenase [Candidatus Omnitrophota bacterium]MDE2230944.1 hydrogenase [Candidatus Omnitrophota bacterium]
MILFSVSLALLSAGILCLALLRHKPRWAENVFLVFLTLGCGSAFISAVDTLIRQESFVDRLPWSLPWGEVTIGIDFVSALFLLAVTLLCFLAGVYGIGYLRNGEHQQDIAGHFCLYLVFLMSLMLVVTARNAVLFLLAWEGMSVSSYFLITYHDGNEEVRQAGLLYLIAAHIGTLCLWVMFILLGTQAGSMDFGRMSAAQFPLMLAGVVFVLGTIGFGVKAGFIPLHIWLPHAHPAAPSHVSAVLSGVMIKMGIYGIIRLIMMVKHFPPWCPAVLTAIGIVSGVGGVLYALGQHEIKKLLAYHSIENIGIIALGLGIGLWGQLNQYHTIAVIGYAGALLHVFNHAMFKGLLFLSAGSVIRQTHTGEIDHLGGLLKYLPWTGALFLIGSLAICGLPLFNGFISEWLVYRALFEGVFSFPMEPVILIGLAIIALALIGGLALMCFTKAFGTVFLGQARSQHAADLKENSAPMIAPMAVLAGVCVWIGIFPQTMVSFCLQGAMRILPTATNTADMANILRPVQWMVLSLFVLIGISIFLVLFRRMAMKNMSVAKSGTWGCGYAAASPRMQYTASSFASPIVELFREVLCLRRAKARPQQIFPEKVLVASEVIDASEHFFWRRIYRLMQEVCGRMKSIQCGYAQIYVLYIFIFLFLILIWKVT